VRLLAVTLVALLALAAPAAADNDPRPVVGGGSFNAAPILPQGRYRDSLLPSEYLYYAFELEAGQRLRVTANADMDLDRFQRSGLVFIAASFHSPTRSPVSSSGENSGTFRVEGEEDMDITGPAPVAEADAETDGPWPGPGVYYLSFHAVYAGPDEPPPRFEVPFHFDVEVVGEAVATPTPSPTPSPTPTPAPPPPPEAAPTAQLAAGAGVGGLLLGVIAGIAARRRRP